MESDEFLLNLHKVLLHTRETVCEAANRNDLQACAIAIGDKNEKVGQLFDIQNKLVENGALPPLPELQAFIWAYSRNYAHYDMPTLALKFLYPAISGLNYRRDYLRYLFEAQDNSEACNCLVLAQIMPTEIPPQRDKLREVRFKEHYSCDDYVCESCGTKWHLEEGGTEDEFWGDWEILELASGKVNQLDYDKYGKALAESRSQVGLTINVLKKTLDDSLPAADIKDENYHTLLRTLAHSGIVDIGSLQSLLDTYKPKSHNRSIWDMLSLFYEEKAENWLIDLR